MEDKITQIVKEKFGAEVVSITRITEGYSHSMFDVKIDKKPFEIIIRFSNNEHKKWANLGKEFYVLNLMAKNKIPVPKVYSFKKTPEYSYMILEKVKGTRLDTIWNMLSETGKAKITEQIGELMSKLHKIELAHFGMIEEGGEIDFDKPFVFKSAGTPIQYNASIRQKFKDFLESYARFISFKDTDLDFASKLIKYLLNNISLLEYKGKPVLLHGDMMLGHIFVQKENEKYIITGLIDVEFAEAGDPMYDFIKLHRQGFFDDIKLKKALVRSYGSKINEKTIEMFRLMRDFEFAAVLLSSGDIKTANSVLESLKKRINNST